MKKRIIASLIAILYIAVLIYTGISKIINYTVFQEQTAYSPLLSFLGRPIALILPWIELALAASLIFPRLRLKGLYATLLLFMLFTVYMIAHLYVNAHVPCGCGGVLEQLSWKQHILFNVFMISIGAIAAIIERRLIKERLTNRATMRTDNILQSVQH